VVDAHLTGRAGPMKRISVELLLEDEFDAIYTRADLKSTQRSGVDTDGALRACQPHYARQER
jgi:hypothetical protein